MNDSSDGEWLLEQIYEDSSSCFILGKIKNHLTLERFSNFEHVVWFIEDYNLPKESKLYKNVYPMTLDSIDVDKMEEIIKTLLKEDKHSVPAIYCSNSITKVNPSAYNIILQKIQIFSEEKLRAYNTIQSLGFLSQKNIIRNIGNFVENQLSEKTKSFLLNKPIAIIGGGPSLDKSIEVLKKNHKKIILFCTDTACLHLAKSGLVPDFVISLDPEKRPDDYASFDIQIKSLFLSLKSPVSWMKFNTEKTHFINGTNLVDQWLSENGFKSNIPIIKGNVGITAVELAEFWGCNPIMLFGMDHCISNSGKIYTSECPNTDDFKNQHESTKSAKTVVGNYSPSVKTHVLNDWENLDKLISNISKKVEVWNVTDWGAKFVNAKLIHPDKFFFENNEILNKTKLKFTNIENNIENGHICSLVQVLEDILLKNKFHIDNLNSFKKCDNHLCSLIAKILQDKDIFRLFGNFTLKTAPLLMKWSELSQKEKDEILFETQSMTDLLQTTLKSLKNKFLL